ncbi:MAG: cytochrome c biogenesis protein CcsA, partial [Bacteroidales bacterium]
TATIIEKYYGTVVARISIYNNPAFYILQAILVINFVAMATKLRLLRQGKYGTIFIHSALAIILCGALITNLYGEEGSIHIREGETAEYMLTSDGSHKKLPYTLTLDKFSIRYYNGSSLPSSYTSHVTIHNKGEEYKAEITMNKILRTEYQRIYQTSYDNDMKGSVLTVNTDFCGTTITYAGYLLLLTGFILSFIGKNSRIREILKLLSANNAKKLTIILIFICSSATYIHATDNPQKYIIPKDQATRWERILIQNSNGRIEPLECYARNILRKITHTGSVPYGTSGAGLVISLACYSEYWCTVPLLYCNDKELKWRLGLKDNDYIAYNDLYDEKGKFKLTQLASHTSRNDTKLVTSITKLIEKSEIFYSMVMGSSLRIFPVSTNKKWMWQNDDLTGIDSVNAKFISSTFTLYKHGIIKKEDTFTSLMLDNIEAYQQYYAPKETSAQTKTTFAIFYSRVPIFNISGIGYLAAGFLLAFMAFSYMRNMTFMHRIHIGAAEGVVVAFYLLHTTGIALRWYISEQPPWSNTYETMVYAAWAMLTVGLMFMRHYPLVTALSAIMGGITLLISSLNWLDPVITPLVPVLNSPWLILHVTIITASYGFFGICALLGLTSMGLLLTKRPDCQLIKELRLINEFSAHIGLILVTVGTFLGAVWANLSWGRYWGWDAKETWSLITIIVYTLITHMRLIPSLHSDTAF